MEDGNCAVDLQLRPSAPSDLVSASELAAAAHSILNISIRRNLPTGGTRNFAGEV